MGLLIFALVIGYFLIGTYVIDSEFGKCLNNANPLWRIPAFIFWPILVLYSFALDVIDMIVDYIDEVEEWYKKNKKEE